MKRIGILLCALCLVLLCGCGNQEAHTSPISGDSGDAQPYYPEEATPVVVPLVKRLENGDIQATIHGGLLIDDEGDVLTEEQIADGFIDAVRNEDSSVTYTIAGDRYDAFLEKHKQVCRDAIVDGAASGSFESVYAAEVNDDFSFVKATAETAGYASLDAAEACFQSAIYAIRAQAFDINAPGTCTISVVDETSGEEHERHIYPDEFQLFPVEDE